MASYEALYGRKCRSQVHWDEAGERRYWGPELIEQATEAITKIRKWMKTPKADRRAMPIRGDARWSLKWETKYS